MRSGLLNLSSIGASDRGLEIALPVVAEQGKQAAQLPHPQIDPQAVLPRSSDIVKATAVALAEAIVDALPPRLLPHIIHQRIMQPASEREVLQSGMEIPFCRHRLILELASAPPRIQTLLDNLESKIYWRFLGPEDRERYSVARWVLRSGVELMQAYELGDELGSFATSGKWERIPEALSEIQQSFREAAQELRIYYSTIEQPRPPPPPPPPLVRTEPLPPKKFGYDTEDQLGKKVTHRTSVGEKVADAVERAMERVDRVVDVVMATPLAAITLIRQPEKQKKQEAQPQERKTAPSENQAPTQERQRIYDTAIGYRQAQESKVFLDRDIATEAELAYAKRSSPLVTHAAKSSNSVAVEFPSECEIACRDPQFQHRMPIVELYVPTSGDGVLVRLDRYLQHHRSAVERSERITFDEVYPERFVPSVATDLRGKPEPGVTQITFPVKVNTVSLPLPVGYRVRSLTWLNLAGEEIEIRDGTSVRECLFGSALVIAPQNAARLMYQISAATPEELRQKASLDLIARLEKALPRLSTFEAAEQVTFKDVLKEMIPSLEERVKLWGLDLRRVGFVYSRDPFLGTVLEMSGSNLLSCVEALRATACDPYAAMVAAKLHELGAPGLSAAGLIPKDKGFRDKVGHSQALYLTEAGVGTIDCTLWTSRSDDRASQVMSLGKKVSVLRGVRGRSPQVAYEAALKLREKLKLEVEREPEGKWRERLHTLKYLLAAHRMPDKPLDSVGNGAGHEFVDSSHPSEELAKKYKVIRAVAFERSVQDAIGVGRKVGNLNKAYELLATWNRHQDAVVRGDIAHFDDPDLARLLQPGFPHTSVLNATHELLNDSAVSVSSKCSAISWLLREYRLGILQASDLYFLGRDTILEYSENSQLREIGDLFLGVVAHDSGKDQMQHAAEVVRRVSEHLSARKVKTSIEDCSELLTKLASIWSQSEMRQPDMRQGLTRQLAPAFCNLVDSCAKPPQVFLDVLGSNEECVLRLFRCARELDCLPWIDGTGIKPSIQKAVAAAAAERLAILLTPDWKAKRFLEPIKECGFNLDLAPKAKLISEAFLREATKLDSQWKTVLNLPSENTPISTILSRYSALDSAELIRTLEYVQGFGGIDRPYLEGRWPGEDSEAKLEHEIQWVKFYGARCNHCDDSSALRISFGYETDSALMPSLFSFPTVAHALIDAHCQRNLGAHLVYQIMADKQALDPAQDAPFAAMKRDYPEIWNKFLENLDLGRYGSSQSFRSIFVQKICSELVQASARPDRYHALLWLAAVNKAPLSGGSGGAVGRFAEELQLLPWTPTSGSGEAQARADALFASRFGNSVSAIRGIPESSREIRQAMFLAYSASERERCFDKVCALPKAAHELARFSTYETPTPNPGAEVWKGLYSVSGERRNYENLWSEAERLSRILCQREGRPVAAPYSRYLIREYGQFYSRNSSGELHELRQYVPGDDIRQIAARASGKTDKLLVRKNRETEAREILLVIDVDWLAHEGDGSRRRANENLALKTLFLNLFLAEREEVPVGMVLLGHSQLDRYSNLATHRKGDRDPTPTFRRPEFRRSIGNFIESALKVRELERAVYSGQGTPPPTNLFACGDVQFTKGTAVLLGINQENLSASGAMLHFIKKQGGAIRMLKPFGQQRAGH